MSLFKEPTDIEPNRDELPQSTFPARERLIGCPYEGTDTGMRFTGVIADVVHETGRVAVYNEEGDTAFTLNYEFGSWYMEGDTLRVHIYYVGSYDVRNVRP